MAVDVLRRVYRGAFAAPALSSALSRMDAELADVRDRSLVTDLVYGTLRHQLFLDSCLAPRLAAPQRLPNDVLTALRIAAYELLVRGTPRHAGVAEWVETIKVMSPRLAGLGNAVLRRLEIVPHLPWFTRCSLPEWLAESFQGLLGADTESAAQGMLEPEPLWLSTFGNAEQLLSDDGCEVRPGPLPGTVAVRCPLPLGRLRAFRDGLVQPQNPASRLPVIALFSGHGFAGSGSSGRGFSGVGSSGVDSPGPGSTTVGAPGSAVSVLDLASGNGIKSALLASLGARVTAVEVDPGKVRRAKSNLARLGLNVSHVVADLREIPSLPAADLVLLDAPCSGTGTLRGNPEIKLRLGSEDVSELSRLQAQLLASAAALTAPGGVLVYSVCALTPGEGPEGAEAFLAEHKEFEALPLEFPVQTRPAGPGRVVLPLAGLDGFFITALKRSRR